MTVDSPTASSIGGNHPLGLFPFQSTQSRRISPSTSPQLHHSVYDGKVKIEFLYWKTNKSACRCFSFLELDFYAEYRLGPARDIWCHEGIIHNHKYKCNIFHIHFFKVSSIDNCDSFSNGRNIGKLNE